jgi:hypothetical protein
MVDPFADRICSGTMTCLNFDFVRRTPGGRLEIWFSPRINFVQSSDCFVRISTWGGQTSGDAVTACVVLFNFSWAAGPDYQNHPRQEEKLLTVRFSWVEIFGSGLQ